MRSERIPTLRTPGAAESASDRLRDDAVRIGWDGEDLFAD
jgi:hypothetical protein